jgi:hypothetical protein
VQPMGYESGKWTNPFRAAFLQPPAATIVSQAGMWGGDGSWAILTSDATAFEFGIATDKDQVLDTERSHGTEQINYVAVSSLAPVRLSGS